ncbi:DUF6549 family protein [Bacteroides graminisolvens]|uniref:DUF6549 family protein n=1 Tax=Bacteroides graminisolvens TaxID=477666 RepID=UPI0029C662EB|nr:DUF6549 family protein [Bacteroides graminisolvens]
MKKYLIITAVFIALLSGVAFLLRQNKTLRMEAKRQAGNVSTLMEDAKRYKIRDSLNVLSVSALRLTVDELKKYRANDAKLIKEFKLRPKDVQYITHTETVTRDSLVYVPESDSCFHYRDKWLSVDACLRDSSMVVQSRDSIVQIIHAVYKHRFLWWRWGLKGIRQEVVNFNPNSHILYRKNILIKINNE